MHEYHAVEAIVKRVIIEANAHQACRISKIKIVLGKLLGFDESSLRLYFEAISADTIAAGAQLEIEYKEGQDSSREIYIENIEVEI